MEMTFLEKFRDRDFWLNLKTMVLQKETILDYFLQNVSAQERLL